MGPDQCGSGGRPRQRPGRWAPRALGSQRVRGADRPDLSLTGCGEIDGHQNRPWAVRDSRACARRGVSHRADVRVDDRQFLSSSRSSSVSLALTQRPQPRPGCAGDPLGEASALPSLLCLPTLDSPNSRERPPIGARLNTAHKSGVPAVAPVIAHGRPVDPLTTTRHHVGNMLEYSRRRGARSVPR
jgi:hypothetical protein